MSLLLRSPNSPTRDGGLPATYAATIGFPTAGLEGLYLMQPGAYSTDSSGNGKTLSRVRGAAPTQQSWGHQVTDQHGVAWDTGITVPASGAVIVAVQATHDPTTDTGLYSVWQPDIGIPGADDGNYDDPGCPYPVIWGNSSAAKRDTFNILDRNTSHVPGNIYLARGYGYGTQQNIICYRWNNSTGVVDLMSMRGRISYQAAGLIGYWSGFSAAKQYIGFMPYASVRPAIGNFFGAALYSGVTTDATVMRAMTALARIKWGTGLRFQGVSFDSNLE